MMRIMFILWRKKN